MEKDMLASAVSTKQRASLASSKSEFIKGLPLEMPVRDVIHHARENGFDVSKAYVHEIRASMRKLPSAMAEPLVSSSVSVSEAKLQAAFAFASSESPSQQASELLAVKEPPVAASSAQSKREYIMSIPLDVPVRQVLEDAHSAGFPVSKAYVHEVRSKLKEKQRVAAQKAAKGKGSKVAAADDEPSRHSDAKKEAAFRKLVVELGTSRARSLLEQVERKLSALFLDD